MELFQLNYAVTLGKTCNFSRAAEKLFITQPTLSYQIQRLENEVGFPLFLRTSKSVSVTVEGRKFLKEAEKVLKEYDRLCKTAQELSQSFNAELTLGTSSLSSIHISEGISAFIEAFPQVKFQLVESWDPDLVEMLRREELDVALLCMEDLEQYSDQFVIHPILKEHMCAVMSKGHPLAGRESIALEELRGERLILDAPGSELRKTVQHCFEAEGILPERTMEVSSQDTRLSLTRQGGVTFAMNEQILLYLADKRDEGFAVIPLEPPHIRSFALVTTREKSKTFVVQSFLDIAMESVRRRFESQETARQLQEGV